MQLMKIRQAICLDAIAYFDPVDDPRDAAGLTGQPLSLGARLLPGHPARERHHTLVCVDIDVERI